MSLDQPSSSPCSVQMILRLMFAGTRGIPLIRGASTLLNVLGELSPPTNRESWTIDITTCCAKSGFVMVITWNPCEFSPRYWLVNLADSIPNSASPVKMLHSETAIQSS